MTSVFEITVFITEILDGIGCLRGMIGLCDRKYYRTLIAVSADKLIGNRWLHWKKIIGDKSYSMILESKFPEDKIIWWWRNTKLQKKMMTSRGM